MNSEVWWGSGKESGQLEDADVVWKTILIQILKEI
jgi:hypothetical protein